MTRTDVDSSGVLIDRLAREIFRDHAARAASSTAHDEPVSLDQDLWTAIVDSGFDGVLAAAGDVTLRDALSVLHHAGYYAVRVPLAEAILARWIACQGRPQEDTPLPIASPARVETDGSRYVTTGVPWGRSASTLYVWVGNRLGRIPARSLRVEPGENLAREPHDVLAFEQQAVQWLDVAVSVDEFLARGALLRAALMAGAMERALDLAVDHAATRVQFGRPIGGFQAIQQMLAQLAGHVAAASAAIDFGGDRGSVFAAAVAKSRAGEAAGFAADIAHQVIAAMGLTVEHPLHLVTRRLWSWREEWGNETYWNRRIGAEALASGGSGLWPMLAARSG